MAKRKPIKLKYGKFKELVKISGANRITVWRALKWHADSPKENEIRKMAKDLNLIRRF